MPTIIRLPLGGAAGSIKSSFELQEEVFTSSAYVYSTKKYVALENYVLVATLEIGPSWSSYHYVGVRLGDLYFGLKNYWESSNRNVTFHVFLEPAGIINKNAPDGNTGKNLFNKNYSGQAKTMQLKIVKQGKTVYIFENETLIATLDLSQYNLEYFGYLSTFGSSYNQPTQKIKNLNFIGVAKFPK